MSVNNISFPHAFTKIVTAEGEEGERSIDEATTASSLFYRGNSTIFNSKELLLSPPSISLSEKTLLSSSSSYLRKLQHNDFNNRNNKVDNGTDGTFAILIVVSILFCFIWAPVVLRRCRIHISDDDDHRDLRENELLRFEAEARAIRETLQRMALYAERAAESRSINQNGDDIELMRQNRKEYISNVLLTKRVVVTNYDIDIDKTRNNNVDSEFYFVKPPICEECYEMPTESQNGGQSNSITVKSETLANSTNYNNAADNSTFQSSDNEHVCSICLNEYEEGDIVCYSHNRLCNHIFHSECMQEWLCSHDECPCCRNNYLNFITEEEASEYYGRNQRQNRSPPATVLSPTETSADTESSMAFVVMEGNESQPPSLTLQPSISSSSSRLFLTSADENPSLRLFYHLPTIGYQSSLSSTREIMQNSIDANDVDPDNEENDHVESDSNSSCTRNDTLNGDNNNRDIDLFSTIENTYDISSNTSNPNDIIGTSGWSSRHDNLSQASLPALPDSILDAEVTSTNNNSIGIISNTITTGDNDYEQSSNIATVNIPDIVNDFVNEIIGNNHTNIDLSSTQSDNDATITTETEFSSTSCSQPLINATDEALATESLESHEKIENNQCDDDNQSDVSMHNLSQRSKTSSVSNTSFSES